ncbi:hypothetical protein [Bradyrhizobium sp. NP1]|uniref:lipase family protein n=1 Tax=Bradyrhizobium sp. NP1 TaxID=3049772 RepID=UPI0025A4CFB9|nr:hypothetical protein [Bradyrhizobium sp. NP1]WJR78934.1 hypothetical protein QOU61_03780 [Bradyrhizobium sp. NP1]
MGTLLRSIFPGIMMAASLLMTDPGPAAAQSGTDGGQAIKASFVYKFARYYAPYAIQAAAAYLPPDQLDALKQKWDQDNYGADVTFAVASLQTDDQVAKSARDAFKNWQYQFGSDRYLDCLDWNDADCKREWDKRGWSFGQGPAYQVWARTRFPHSGNDVCTEVSIAFRGTVGLNRWDWVSNADRYYTPYDDYYYQLRRNINAIVKQITNLDCYRRAVRKPQIVSTGHSLGGGLAQFAALANKPSGPRITKVFAFDPSPVTGAHLLTEDVRRTNAKGLTVDRIYQEGEVLSYARGIVEEFPPAGKTCDPFVRTVRVDALPSGGAVDLHAIRPLAVQLVRLSYDDNTPLAYRPPDAPANCDVRYLAPSTEDGTVVASAGGASRRALLASNRRRGESAARFAASRQDAIASSDPIMRPAEVTLPVATARPVTLRSKRIRAASARAAGST